MIQSNSLKYLSDQALIEHTKKLAREERRITLAVLRSLSEVESRRLYAEVGYSSLWEFATKALGYSDGAAARRIKSMQLLKEVPEAEAKVLSGELTLTTISQIQRFFSAEEKRAKSFESQQSHEPDLFQVAGLGGFSQGMGHCGSNPNTFKKMDEKIGQGKDQNIDEGENQNGSQESGELSSGPQSKRDLILKLSGLSSRDVERELLQLSPQQVKVDKVRALSGTLTELRLTIDIDLKNDLDRLKGLLSHKNPRMSYGELFKELAQIALKKLDPLQGSGKTSIGKTSKFSASTDSGAEGGRSSSQLEIQPPLIDDQKVASSRSRHIPAQLKREVWQRDQGRCQYRDPKTNRQCESRHLIQIHHIEAFAKGGPHTLSNLELRCRCHNLHQAIKEFGEPLNSRELRRRSDMADVRVAT